MPSEFRVCSNCVMDTTDTKIVFDDAGVCDHCNEFNLNVLPHWDHGRHGQDELERIVQKIKHDGKGRDFDCIMGFSGGTDSSYMLHYIVKELGLRPLVFHVDAGWNTQEAVANIHAMVNGLGVDLFTEVINWEEMKDFQLAFFKSGLPCLDIPQDHAFVATLYDFAEKYKIKYILNGGNFSTECVRNPLDWMYYGTDMALIKDVRRQFCTSPLENYPFSGVLRHKLYLKYFRRVNVFKPLNYFPYIKQDAQALLAKEYGWIPFPEKHYESRFTKFYEGYWMPTRFGFDTRKVQYSSLILTNQMTRDRALELLSKPAYTEENAKRDFDYVASKLDISSDELQSYMDAPLKFHKDYRNSEWLFNLGAKIMKGLGIERAVKR